MQRKEIVKTAGNREEVIQMHLETENPWYFG
jgi:hypothetical protein